MVPKFTFSHDLNPIMGKYPSLYLLLEILWGFSLLEYYSLASWYSLVSLLVVCYKCLVFLSTVCFIVLGFDGPLRLLILKVISLLIMFLTCLATLWNDYFKSCLSKLTVPVKNKNYDKIEQDWSLFYPSVEWRSF